MSDYTIQDLYVWTEKARQMLESRTRARADVAMLEQAVAKVDAEMVHAHHSSSQLDFANTELARVEAQYDIAWGKIKEIVADMDAAKK